MFIWEKKQRKTGEFRYSMTNSPLVAQPIRMQDLHQSTSWVILNRVRPMGCQAGKFCVRIKVRKGKGKLLFGYHRDVNLKSCQISPFVTFPSPLGDYPLCWSVQRKLWLKGVHVPWSGFGQRHSFGDYIQRPEDLACISEIPFKIYLAQMGLLSLKVSGESTNFYGRYERVTFLFNQDKHERVRVCTSGKSVAITILQESPHNCQPRRV